jgi:outer membrane immunogenic protein
MLGILMKKALLSATAIALALAAGSAFAADLPSRKEAPVYIPPRPSPLWTGFYAGLNAGGTWAESQSVNTVSGPMSDFLLGGGPSWAGMASVGASGFVPVGGGGGFIGGGQIGYNYQFDNSFVVGLEADIQGVASSNSNGSAASAVGPFAFFGAGEVHTTFINSSKNLDYIGTVRGRIGYLFTPALLVYGTGGLAYGGVTASTSISQSNNDCVGFPGACVQGASFTNGSLSNTQVGWTAGGGVEWMFAPNWSAKVEYLYYDLGNVTFGNGALAYTSGTFPGAGGPAVIASRSSTHFNGNIVRAGVNYHFNWGAPAPVVTKY